MFFMFIRLSVGRRPALGVAFCFAGIFCIAAACLPETNGLYHFINYHFLSYVNHVAK